MSFVNFNRGNLGFGVRLLIMFMILPLVWITFGPATASQSEDDLITGAKKEAKLVWYTTLTVRESDTMLKKFNTMYPFIKTEMFRSGDLKLLTKVMAESRAKKYFFDVIATTGISAEIMKSKGLFAKYQSPQRKFFPKEINDPDGYWTDYYLNINVMGYNTRMVAPHEVPKTFEDLLDPQWKGKLGMDTKAFYWFANVFKFMGEEKALDYMKKLAKQEILFRTGRTLNAQMLAAGEVDICITLYNNRVEQMKSDGAPIEWFVIEPVVPELHPVAISAHAPHPNVAKLFVDFILSEEGQQMIVDFYRIPSRMGTSPKIPSMKEGIKILPFDFSIGENYEKYVNLYRDVLMKK